MRNASKLLSAAAPFASIVLRRSDWGCKGKDYINDGVMLLRPSVEAYAALYGSFVSGEFVRGLRWQTSASSHLPCARACADGHGARRPAGRCPAMHATEASSHG